MRYTPFFTKGDRKHFCQCVKEDLSSVSEERAGAEKYLTDERENRKLRTSEVARRVVVLCSANMLMLTINNH